jgi:hypothetical protein
MNVGRNSFLMDTCYMFRQYLAPKGSDKVCMMTTRLACNRAIESSYWRMDNDSDVGLLMVFSPSASYLQYLTFLQQMFYFISPPFVMTLIHTLGLFLSLSSSNL